MNLSPEIWGPAYWTTLHVYVQFVFQD
ncbi:MAG: hypothetical protein RL766_2197, partial [Bacteroidota bacterium]